MLETLNDRAQQPQSNSTSNQTVRDDMPSSPETGLSEPPEPPELPKTTEESSRPAKRRYVDDNSDSSPILPTLLMRHPMDGYEDTRPPLETQVSSYFKLCVQKYNIDSYRDPIRYEGENIDKFVERMAKATIKFWNEYDRLNMLKPVAKSVLSVPGSNAIVERVFNSVKELMTDRRFKMNEATVQRTALSKITLKYTHIPADAIKDQFLSYYVKDESDEKIMTHTPSTGPELDNLNPQSMIPRLDVGDDEVVTLLDKIGRSEYFFPKNYDDLEKNLNEIGDVVTLIKKKTRYHIKLIFFLTHFSLYHKIVGFNF